MNHSTEYSHSSHSSIIMSVARELFDRMFQRDVVSWTTMIDGFVNRDLPIEGIELFQRMLGLK